MENNIKKHNRHSWKLDFPYNKCIKCGCLKNETFGTKSGGFVKGKRISLYSINGKDWNSEIIKCIKE